MNRFVYFIFIGIILIGLIGCSGDDKKTAADTSLGSVKTKKVDSPKPVAVSEEKKRPEYVIKGKRDPFQPFEIGVPVKIAGDKGKREDLSPLQKLTLSQIKLVGTIWGDKKSALIQDSSGMGYIIKEGMFLGENSGIVTRISPDGITIKQHFKDYRGRVNTREVVLRLRKEEGER
ncbi:MAG: pilus assembly protein PilP [Deltaproteobacteria bacterium]|nr:pilus assembly protein PilP [Deltaproteobacteria bacterium]